MNSDEILQLTLATLGDLDYGKAQEAFNVCLRRAVADISDRPADSTARTVTLQFTMTPVVEPSGDCTEVEMEIDCKAKIPAYRTKKLSLGIRRGGLLAFRPDSPENINQPPLTMGDGD